jgi:hypothetical protein
MWLADDDTALRALLSGQGFAPLSGSGAQLTLRRDGSCDLPVQADRESAESGNAQQLASDSSPLHSIDYRCSWSLDGTTRGAVHVVVQYLGYQRGLSLLLTKNEAGALLVGRSLASQDRQISLRRALAR